MTNTEERPAVPHQAPPPAEPSAEGRRHMIRRRAITLIIIVLLIGVPAGYLIISANQSRDSGKDKEDKYSATGLTGGGPSKLQQRIYNVRMPEHYAAAATYETNNWKVSRLYVQFLTTPQGLRSYLHQMGTGVTALEKNKLTVSARDRRVADWDFTGTGEWAGLTHTDKKPQPTVDVVVNRSNPKYPQVYVVSTTIP